MKNLLERLCQSGLTKEQAEKTVEVIYQWLADKYPVLGALAKATFQKDDNCSTGERS